MKTKINGRENDGNKTWTSVSNSSLALVQNKFALQKDFWFRNFWTKYKCKFQEKFLPKKFWVQKI